MLRDSPTPTPCQESHRRCDGQDREGSREEGLRMMGTRVPEVMRLLTEPSWALGTTAGGGSTVRTLGVGILPGLCPITSFIPTSQGALGNAKHSG